MVFEPLSGLVKYSRDTKNNWEVTNPILPLDVFCFELNSGDFKLKIGDGVRRWNDTPYFVDQLKVLADMSIRGVVFQASNLESLDGIEDTKYITTAQLLVKLNTYVSGDLIILTPGSTIYQRVDAETYITNGDYPALRPYGSSVPKNPSAPDIAFRMEHKGEITLSYQQRKGLGNTYIRIAKNLEIVDEQVAASFSYRTYTFNISVVPGDIIQVQARDASFLWSGRIRNVRILVANIP